MKILSMSSQTIKSDGSVRPQRWKCGNVEVRRARGQDDARLKMSKFARASSPHCGRLAMALISLIIVVISLTTLANKTLLVSSSEVTVTRAQYYQASARHPEALLPRSQTFSAPIRRRQPHFIEQQQPQAGVLLTSGASSLAASSAPAAPPAVQPYKCAKFCTCSSVSVLENNNGAALNQLSVIESPLDAASEQIASPALQMSNALLSGPKPPADLETRLINLTRVKCDSSQFSDVLTIDRRTQIIHISLPQDKTTGGSGSSAPSPSSPRLRNSSLDYATRANWPPPLITRTLNPNKLNVSGQDDPTEVANNVELATGEQAAFRMPRLAQFSLLREIVIINLKFEVCDSEVFKRGQRLKRLKWNFNELRQVSRDCFRHLDKLIELNLDHNQLIELESALFSNLIHLKHLSLAHNKLAELAAHQFANLTRLASLNLVGNSFKSINLFLLEPMCNSLQLLVLARNQIKSFVYLTTQLGGGGGASSNRLSGNSTAAASKSQQQAKQPTGALFRNLIKLNVDSNRFERIKMLQLHRFYNVKFLSLRANQIQSIRDRAFDGLKLIELNLAQNKLQLISRCAFCNSTIKRLVLAENNISLPLLGGGGGGALPPASLLPVDPKLPSAQQLVAANELPLTPPEVPPSQPLLLSATGSQTASSASMLVLSQSILGPLFNQLEYLDLSHNHHLAPQLELLLEPLLELQYLNLASIGLDRALPTPMLFKNLRQLKYLNLSSNALDQLIAETVEPLTELEMLDLSSNAFNELDESLLVTLDELPRLKYLNLASNPWYCSQCKISPLYDWILRSPIYNATCLAPTVALAGSGGQESPQVDEAATKQEGGSSTKLDDELEATAAIAVAAASEFSAAAATSEQPQGFVYRQAATSARGPHDYSLLGNSDVQQQQDIVDFDLILNLFESSQGQDVYSGATREPNYQLDPAQAAGRALEVQARRRHLSERLLKSLATGEDDESIERTIASLTAASQLLSGFSPANPNESDQPNDLADQANGSDGDETISLASSALRKLRVITQNTRQDLCLKCEFPSELRAFNLHELAPTDFKYCAGSAPRFAASEPKIGLTLAIVIIGALFCVIVVVIIMYRKKSNAYYPGDELTSQLENGLTSGNRSGKGNQPVLSISSDLDNGGGAGGGGDATDYSSPPMSQSYESYSQDDDDEGDELDEDEEEDDEDEDEDEEDDLDDEDEELDEDEDDEEFDDDHNDTQGGASGPSMAPNANEQPTPPPPQPPQAGHKQHKEEHHVTISEANQTDSLHESSSPRQNVALKSVASNTAAPSQPHVSIVPINGNGQSSASNTVKRASQRKPQAEALPNIEVELQRPKRAVEEPKPAELSVVELQQQANVLDKTQPVQVPPTRPTHFEQQTQPVRSVRSHDEPPGPQGAIAHKPLRQSKTTANVSEQADMPPKGFPPLPADFRPPSSQAGASEIPSPVPPPPPPTQQQQLTQIDKPPPPSQQVPRRPKFQQHRQSSEHSTASSVAFATPSAVVGAAASKRQRHHQQGGPTTSPRAQQGKHSSELQRRERLMSQTIAVEPSEVKELIGRGELSAKRSADLPSKQLTMAERPHPSGLAKPEMSSMRPGSRNGRRNEWSSSRGSTSSSSQQQQQLAGVQQPQQQRQQRGDETGAPLGGRVRAKRPSIMATNAIQQRPSVSKANKRDVEAHERAAFEQMRSPQASPPQTPDGELDENSAKVDVHQPHAILVPAKARPPMKQLQQQQRNVIAAPLIRAQHRHHIKQMVSSNFEHEGEEAEEEAEDELGQNGRNEVASNGRLKQHQEEDEDDQKQEDESLDLVAQFADLPSDLEELENVLEQRSDFLSDQSQIVAPLPVRSSAALELMDDEDNEQIASMDRDDDDNERGRQEHFLKLNFNNNNSDTESNQMRNSHSTHSALTQTGSRDFE